MGGALTRTWNFWRTRPQIIVAVFAMGLIASSVTMICAAERYSSFYMRMSTFLLTPKEFGVIGILVGLVVLISSARPWALALFVGYMAARVFLLATAAFGRIDPPPPFTRPIWELCIVAAVLISAPHLRTTYQ